MSRRGHYVTLLLVTWTVAGLLVDIWAHGQAIPESFFSPYHAMFYAGFLATALWLLRLRLAARRGARPAGDSIAPGYGPAVTGLGVFALGGIGDVVWHHFYGVERGIEALTSPAHLLLLAGLALLASAPLCAAWTSQDAPRRPAFATLLPALLSMTLVMLVLAIAMVHLWGLASSRFMSGLAMERITTEFATSDRAAALVREITTQQAIAAIAVTNVVLMAPILLLLRRWRLPFGALTLVVGLVATLMNAVTGMFFAWIVLAPIAGGLVGDALVGALDASPDRPGSLRLFATIFPPAFWSLYFLAVHLHWGVAWTPALWLGEIVWTGGAGLALSIVVVPGGIPSE